MTYLSENHRSVGVSPTNRDTPPPTHTSSTAHAIINPNKLSRSGLPIAWAVGLVVTGWGGVITMTGGGVWKDKHVIVRGGLVCSFLLATYYCYHSALEGQTHKVSWIFGRDVPTEGLLSLGCFPITGDLTRDLGLDSSTRKSVDQSGW
ncbi:hypothetical protein BS17DRAFT_766546 [Gyrodon lividus]|nr:hypothetical protein BS17DRAFT_766546 [Gyrodon lividus]